MEKTFTFNGAPYFILERNGVFQAVKALKTIDETGQYLGIKHHDSDEHTDLVNLTLGLNIREIPDRRINILVEVPIQQADMWSIFVIEECRKLASVAGCDYVSVEKFGANLDQLIYQNSDTIFNKVRPRLFRKIVNN